MKDFDLLTELKKYKPQDKKEMEYVKQTIDFLEHGENQFVRTNLKMHLVAGAYLLNEKMDKVLLTNHKALGIWLPFGGHSDGEKNSLNVALREVREESGIENIDIGNGEIIDVDIHTIPENLKKNEPEHKHIEIRFIFKTPQEQFVMSDESNAVAWMSIDEFKNLLINGNYYSGAERIVKKLDDYIMHEKAKNFS